MTKTMTILPQILLTKAEHQAENWFHSSIKENQPQRDLWKRSSGPLLCLEAQTSVC